MTGSWKFGLIGAAGLAVISSIALAQISPSHPGVIKRVDGMNRIATQAKLIGQMARGIKPVDIARARAAATIIADEAAAIPSLFATWHSDRASEALPSIWDNYADFTARAQALNSAARRAATTMATSDDVATVAASLGRACKSCHQAYRK